VTNWHVAIFGGELELRADSGDIYRSRIEKLDAVHDLAVLAVEDMNAGSAKPLELSASSDKLSAGDAMFALGHPQAVNETYISPGSFRRRQRFIDMEGDGKETPEQVRQRRRAGHPPQDFPSIEALLNRPVLNITARNEPGNSGSPVVDRRGLVQGVLFRGSFDDPAMAGLTPVEDLHRLLEQRSTQQFDYGYAPSRWADRYLDSWSASPAQALAATGAAGGAAALACFGLRRFPALAVMAAGGLSLGGALSDGRQYLSRHSSRDELKYGLSTTSDLVSLVGVAVTGLTARTGAGLALIGVGALGRLATEFIPNRLVLEKTRMIVAS
jgi:hypothetical protein